MTEELGASYAQYGILSISQNKDWKVTYFFKNQWFNAELIKWLNHIGFFFVSEL
jgi:hypothetical protein